MSEEEILCPELLFVILQPFGCLPNHVVGRKIVKKLREMYPDAQILSMDYDPDHEHKRTTGTKRQIREQEQCGDKKPHCSILVW